MPDKMMSDLDTGEEATLFPKTAGERLRESRQAQGLTLEEVAARTRVPVRHLEAIERSDYSGLPSATYSVGFAKAYARAIGLDEVTIGRDVRGQSDRVARPPEYQPYEMQDPKRLPPQGLAMMATAVVIVLLIGIGIWYGTDWFRAEPPAAATAPASEIAAPPPAPATAPAPATNGQVSLVATDLVWMRIYDAAGKTLYQNELKPGERFDVPADADRPMINIGRPDKLELMVNGSSVPPLGDGSRAMKDVPIDSASLLARGSPTAAQPEAQPVASPTAAPLVGQGAARPQRDRERAKPRPRPTVTDVATPVAAPTASAPVTPSPAPTTASPPTAP